MQAMRQFGAGVKFLRLIAVVFVGTVWMTAANHCGLEVAGVIATIAGGDSAECCADKQAGCAFDSCSVTEDGTTLSTAKSTTVCPPVVCDCFSCRLLITPRAPEFIGPNVGADATPWLEWMPAWQFERRAVLPARAPSLTA